LKKTETILLPFGVLCDVFCGENCEVAFFRMDYNSTPNISRHTMRRAGYKESTRMLYEFIDGVLSVYFSFSFHKQKSTLYIV
jgi:hypothetical protein